MKLNPLETVISQRRAASTSVQLFALTVFFNQVFSAPFFNNRYVRTLSNKKLIDKCVSAKTFEFPIKVFIFVC